MAPAEDLGSFHEVMAQLRVGDTAAAERVFHQFAQRLIALARTRLDTRLRQKVDPEDVLQSVYRSFFHRHGQGQFVLEGWDGLWAVLTIITLRKCRRVATRFHTDRRDVQREMASTDELELATISREPTPLEAAVLTETVERLLAGLEGREREIVSLCLQGHSVEEISEQVGRSRRTVQRVLKRVNDELQEPDS
jgi:RNA polymerase sigma-70 factor (ECF subfamily)